MLYLTMAFFTKDYLDFFIELAPNNTKELFDSNRKRYENSVKKPFSDFVQHLIRYFEKHDSRLKDLEPGACIFRIDKDNLYLLREGITARLNEFQELIDAPEFKTVFGEIRGEKNKIIPAEFKQAAEKQELIYNKQWYYMAEFPAEKLLSDDLDRLLERCYLAGKPLEEFFNQFIQRS